MGECRACGEAAAAFLRAGNPAAALRGAVQRAKFRIGGAVSVAQSAAAAPAPGAAAAWHRLTAGCRCVQAALRVRR